MRIKDYALQKAKSTDIGAHLIEDERYRITTRAVCSLIFNLFFAFYNGILGVISFSLIFAASSVYYLMLSLMRFVVVMSSKGGKTQNDRLCASVIGVILIIISVVFHVIVIVSMKYNTAALYGTITMITIATFTFTKITAAVITAVKHRKDSSRLYKAVNAIRYSEVAVSLLTMQQSMLVSFGNANDKSSVILNAFTGAGVCFFILVLGIVTFKGSRKNQKTD